MPSISEQDVGNELLRKRGKRWRDLDFSGFTYS